MASCWDETKELQIIEDHVAENLVVIDDSDEGSSSSDLPSLENILQHKRQDRKTENEEVLVVTSAENSPIKETGKRKKKPTVAAARKLQLQSDENFEEPKSNDGKTTSKLTPDVWAGVPVEEVDYLPYDINGLKIYRLAFDPADKFASSVDGRKWAGYVSSRRSGFSGKRFLKSCKGSHRCPNEMCGYYRQYKEVNRVQFNKNGQCHSCGAEAEFVPCLAKKIWEYPDGELRVTVYHYGFHSCVPIKKSRAPQTDASKAFSQSRTLKPERYANDKLIEAIETEQPLDEIEELADSLVDRSELSQIKKSVNKKLNPEGHSYDAVMAYKEKVQKVLEDPFLIYKVDCERKTVFKTSKQQLNLAIEMDREGQGHLRIEPCHVDGKHNRVTGYITISLVVYDPNLRQMSKIATMECPTESKANVGLFWSYLNKALQEFTGDDQYMFKPHLYVFDEGGGFWASLQETMGPDEVTRAVSCERHWGFTVERNAKKLIGEDVQKEYLFLCDAVLKASTVNMYEKAREQLVCFIDNHSFLSSWWKWWESRRSHIFRAFKPGLNVPKSNLAEVHHSRWHHIGAENLTLIQACREDVAESLKLKRRLEGYRKGAYKGGQGPSAAELQKRRHLDQRKQAEDFCKELDDYVQHNDDMQLRQQEYFVDETAAHRHDPVRKRVQKESGSCSASANKGKEEKRAAPLRNTRSQKFLRSLQIAKSCKNSFRVGKRNDNQITLIHTTGANYNVVIDKLPQCTSCKYCTPRDVCSHILWVLLFVYKVPEGSHLLHQRAFITSELESILGETSTSNRDTTACSGVPASLTSAPATTPTKNTVTTAALTPKAAKDFSDPNYGDQQWIIRRVMGRGRAPTCSSPNCNRAFDKGDLNVQVSCKWIPPYATEQGKRFTVDRNYHFCLKWCCLQSTPNNSNLLAPPAEVKLAEEVGKSLSAEEYSIIFAEELP